MSDSISEEDQEKPNLVALSNAAMLMLELPNHDLKPLQVVESRQGGCLIILSEEDRYADFECLNTGGTFACVCDWNHPSGVWEVNPQKPAAAIKTVKAFLAGDFARYATA